jgi:hypothetical protein
MRLQISVDEKLYYDSRFDSDSSDLHGSLCGGQTQLQENRQKLSHAPQQGMQLRERLRLRQDVKSY